MKPRVVAAAHHERVVHTVQRLQPSNAAAEAVAGFTVLQLPSPMCSKSRSIKGCLPTVKFPDRAQPRACPALAAQCTTATAPPTTEARNARRPRRPPPSPHANRAPDAPMCASLTQASPVRGMPSTPCAESSTKEPARTTSTHWQRKTHHGGPTVEAPNAAPLPAPAQAAQPSALT